MNTNFPQGNHAYQERFLAAFDGLTEIIVAQIAACQPSAVDRDKWQEMFRILTGEEEQDDEVN